LSKYEGIQKRLAANFNWQNELMGVLSRENDVFMGMQNKHTQNRKRIDAIKTLEEAGKINNELKNNLREGIEFYTNFQSILEGFRTTCSDFAFARRAHKNDLINQISQGGTLHSGTVQFPGPQVQTRMVGAFPPSMNQGTLPPTIIPGAWQPHMQPVYQGSPQSNQSTYNPYNMQPGGPYRKN